MEESEASNETILIDSPKKDIAPEGPMPGFFDDVDFDNISVDVESVPSKEEVIITETEKGEGVEIDTDIVPLEESEGPSKEEQVLSSGNESDFLESEGIAEGGGIETFETDASIVPLKLSTEEKLGEDYEPSSIVDVDLMENGETTGDEEEVIEANTDIVLSEGSIVGVLDGHELSDLTRENNPTIQEGNFPIDMKINEMEDIWKKELEGLGEMANMSFQKNRMQGSVLWRYQKLLFVISSYSELGETSSRADYELTIKKMIRVIDRREKELNDITIHMVNTCRGSISNKEDHLNRAGMANFFYESQTGFNDYVNSGIVQALNGVGLSNLINEAFGGEEQTESIPDDYDTIRPDAIFEEIEDLEETVVPLDSEISKELLSDNGLLFQLEGLSDILHDIEDPGISPVLDADALDYVAADLRQSIEMEDGDAIETALEDLLGMLSEDRQDGKIAEKDRAIIIETFSEIVKELENLKSIPSRFDHIFSDIEEACSGKVKEIFEEE
jgi:hypothetical protein